MTKMREYTEEQARLDGMSYSKHKHCPECGCPWYGNKNYCGEGHRVCCDCYQDWWVNAEYSEIAPRRELPKEKADRGAI